MAMGYGANYADVIKTETLGKIIGDSNLVEDFVKKYDGINLEDDGFGYDDLNDTLNCGQEDESDSEGLKELRKVWNSLRDAFRKETGLDIEVDYHSRDDDGDRYDDVNGMFIDVCGLYQPTENYKKLMEKFGKDVIERKFYVSFG